MYSLYQLKKQSPAPCYVPEETESIVTCWKYSVPWVQKQVKALAKQDRFWCWSAGKTMNAHCHNRCHMCHILEVKIVNFPFSLTAVLVQIYCTPFILNALLPINHSYKLSYGCHLCYMPYFLGGETTPLRKLRWNWRSLLKSTFLNRKRKFHIN